jgi:hypothetical protein
MNGGCIDVSCAKIGNKARTLHVVYTRKQGKITGEEELPDEG